METIAIATTFLGWCTVINIVIYAVTALALLAFSDPIKGLHAKFSHVAVEHLDTLYFDYLGRFKLALIFFNMSPYIALKIIAA